MLRRGRAAAYFTPWKHQIERLRRGDVVFLYRSGVGIVAFGRASGRLEIDAYHGDPRAAGEEYAMALASRASTRRCPPPTSSGWPSATSPSSRR